ncbi:MAG: RNA-binding protein [Anaerolineae bacterium]|nr:RNA-binding protein [Anaerolineae bacterium]
MATRLYVGNLPYQATQDELEELFSQAGTVVSVSIITDRDTGRSKGFGFVEMEDDSAGDAAIQRFNGYMLAQRALVVNEARPREERSPRSGSGSGFGRSGGGNGGNRDNRRSDSRGSFGREGNRRDRY